MFRKVLAGGFLLVMVGAVIAGVIALAGRSEDVHAQQPLGQGGRNAAARTESAPQGGQRGGWRQDGDAEDCGADGCTEESALGGGFGRGQSQGQENQASAEQSGGGGRGQGRAGQESAEQSGGGGRGQGEASQSQPEPQADHSDDWQTVEGTVLETSELVIETAEGQTLQIGLGPSHYREGQGFVLEAGETVRVSGYYENDEFKAGEVLKLSTGESILLRDADGRPMWAGRGRRSG